MKKSLFTIVLFLTAFFCNAQHYFHFPDSNAIWTEVSYPPNDGMPVFYCYGLLNKDTVINTIKYHKLYSSSDSIFQENEFCGGIREDTVLKRLYYLRNLTNDNEVILYDFNVNVGDTLAQDSLNNFNFGHEYQFIVQKIDTIIVNNTLRKRISFVYYDDIFNWIEGIGNTRGLLIPSGTFPNNGTWNDLACFKQDSKWLYHYNKYLDCFPFANGIDNIKKDDTSILIYPNPIKNVSYLKLDKCTNQFIFLDIINDSGIKVRSYSVKEKSEIEINKNDFLQGIYFYRLYSKDGYSVFGKFIIE